MRNIYHKKAILSAALAVLLLLLFVPGNIQDKVPGIPGAAGLCLQAQAEETITLRVCNWEEYIDLGDWDEEETIELPSGDIIGENSMVDDFEEWYYETYGKRVKVEYSTFGTNEDLYNMLTLGDVYDLVCPSEYLIMKLMAEEALVPLSEDFFDTGDENNYFIKGEAPFIREIFENSEINGEPWSRYAAGYMWGVTGLVYNPETGDKSLVKKMLREDRIKYFAPADYRENSPLDILVRQIIRKTAEYEKLEDWHNANWNELDNGGNSYGNG